MVSVSLNPRHGGGSQKDLTLDRLCQGEIESRPLRDVPLHHDLHL